MANVEIPKQDGNENSKPSRAAQSTQLKHAQALAYERTFLKKKQELENSARSKQIQSDMALLRERATAEMAFQSEIIKDEERLADVMNQIKLKLAEDLSKKQLELISEQRNAEYAAHEFAVACSMKAFQTQTVHERAKTAATIAEAQKTQAEKLRAVREAEIAELQAQHRVAASSGEKRKITLEIKKIQKEIAAAEESSASYQEQATKYAEIVKKVDFERLSAAQQLAVKQKEVADLQSQADEAVAEIDSKIAAKQIDLEAAKAAGDKGLESTISKELADLKATRDATSAEYTASIDTLKAAIDGKGGYKEKAANAPEVAVVTPQQPAGTEDSVVQDNPLKTQVDAILNYLTELVSVFKTYVDTIESKVTAQVDVSTLPTAPTPPSTDTNQTTQPVVEHLRALVAQTTTDDATAQAELTARLDRLNDLLNAGVTSPEDPTDPEELKTLIADISKFFDRDSGSKKSKKQGEEDDNKKEAEKKTLRTIARENLTGTGERDADGNVDGGKLQAAKEASHEDTIKSYEDQYRLKRAFTTKDGATEALVQGLQKMSDALEDLSKTIDTNITKYFEYQAEIDARLQGTDTDYSDVLHTMTTNLGMSMIVSQKEFIAKFKELVDSGISYNIESRTLLATVSDRVINTFNVLSADLHRLIRLQQADTTAARMGIESSINKLLNSMYSDTSYLSDSGAHDSIESAILQASSMLSRDMSVEFEYIVHKWLGSMYSLGMSSSSLEKIAQGLNYLGTGNVTALNNDESLQTLLAMSASWGGVSYADILTQGLNAETTNKLLAGMLQYLMDIANNTDSSQVTKSAYTDIFGLEMADLRAIQNLTTQDVKELYSLTTTYNKSVQETQDQIDSIMSRTHISQMTNMLFENALLGASLDIGGNPVSYGLWKTLNVVEGLTGGIALPFVNVFGSGLDLNTTVTGLLKGGMAGLALLGNLVTSLGGGGLDGALNLKSDWGLTSDAEFTSRGSAASFMTAGTASGFSTSARVDYNGSGSGTDMKRTAMSDSADDAQEDSEVTNKNVADAQELPEKIYEQTQLIWAALAEEDNTILKQSVAIYDLLYDRLNFSALDSISDLLAPSRLFLTSAIGENGITSNLIKVNQEGQVSIQNYADQLSTASNITSTIIDVMKSSNMSLSDVTVDMWSLIQEFQGNLSTLATDKSVWTNMYSDGFSSVNLTSSQSANEEFVKTVISQVTQQNLSDPQKLADLKEMAEIQALTKVVFPEYVRATVDEFSPDVQKFLQQILKAAVEMSLTGSDGSSSVYDDSELHPVVSQMSKEISKLFFETATNVVTTRQDTTLGLPGMP